MGFAFTLSSTIHTDKCFIVTDGTSCLEPQELWCPTGKWWHNACAVCPLSEPRGMGGIADENKAAYGSWQGSADTLSEALQGFIACTTSASSLSFSFRKANPQSCCSARCICSQALEEGRAGGSDSCSWQNFLLLTVQQQRDKSQHFLIPGKSHRILQHSENGKGGGVSLVSTSGTLSDEG